MGQWRQRCLQPRLASTCPAAGVGQPSVALGGREALAARHRETEAPEDGARLGPRRRAAPVELLGERDQVLLALAAQHRERARPLEERRVHEGIEPVEGEGRVRRELAQAPQGTEREPQGGVHRDGEEDEPRRAHAGGVERLDRQVERGRGEAGCLQEGLRPGDPRRLVSELVGGDEEDGAGGAQPARAGLRHG